MSGNGSPPISWLQQVGEELRSLLTVDTAQSRTQVYLRLLYSPSAGAQARVALTSFGSLLPPRTVAFLETVDFDRLQVEQAARARNLAHQLGQSCPSFHSVMPRADYQELVRRFADSPSFWIYRGRTLAENFALFAHRELASEGNGFLADLVRLEGLVAGLSNSPEKPSPWPQGSDSSPFLQVEGSIPTEWFDSRWAMLDSRGNLPSPENLAEVSAPAPHRIVIALQQDRGVTVIARTLNTT